MANQFLIKETMADMKTLSAAEITALQGTNPAYAGVELLGYYEKGDTPAPIRYYVGTTQLADDGFSVIVIQNIKLVHRFIGAIDVSYAGCSPTVLDNSLIINKVISYASSNGVPKVINRQTLNIVVKEASRTAGGIELKSNISFENLGKLTMSPTSFDTYAMISGKDLSNVEIIGGEIIGDRLTHTGTGGEHGMGIFMFNCKDFIIRDLKVNNCWGDGICLGGHPNPTLGCKKFAITNVVSTYNRRQGLSIGNADQGIITDSEFSYSAGTNPQSGVDIEPNGGQAVSNLMFQNIICNNNANTGFQTYSEFGEISNITVNGLSCSGNGSEGILFRHPNNSNISLNNVTINNSPYGAVFRQGTKNISLDKLSMKEISMMGIRIIDNSSDLSINAVHSDNTVNKIVSVFEASNVKLSQFLLSGSYVELAKMNNSLLDNWKCSEVTAPNFITMFSGSDNTLQRIDITGGESMLRGIFLDSLGAKVNNRLKEIYIANAKTAAIEANNVTDINLVDSYFYNSKGTAHVKLGTAVVGAVISNNIFRVGASVSVIPQYCIQLGNNLSKIRIKLNDYYGAFSANVPIGGFGAAVDSIYMLDNASGVGLGMVRLSSNISNANTGIPSDNSQSSATDLSGVVSDFNSLVIGYNSLLDVVGELQTKLNAKLEADRNSGQQAY